MRILFFGDVSGRSGREALYEQLPLLKKRFQADVAIVNAENSAAGFGVTVKIANELFEAGADCLTTGNHVWKQRELLLQIGTMPRILRPLNFSNETPGKGFYIHALPDGRRILIASLLGRLFMDPFTDDPFAAFDQLLDRYPLGPTNQNGAVQAIFVDYHAEATSEKRAFAGFFDGRTSAIIGTHTHIPTADEVILPGGTAYQSDAGMCGDYNSVIGIKFEHAIGRFIRKIPGEKPAPAEGPATVCGVFVETDDTTGRALKIERIQIGGLLKQTTSLSL